MAAVSTGKPKTPSCEEVVLGSVQLRDGQRQIVLTLADLRCGGCVNTVERALRRLAGITYARANLTLKQLTLRWNTAAVPPFVATLTALGYPPQLHPEQTTAPDETVRGHLRALAVSGFAAANVMLLSVSVWSGADPQTRVVFHWLSALIALPALAWSGQIFFRSAWQALRRGRVNMDVPITVGVVLATAMSLYDTATGGERTYFEAVLMLVFFLLIGRTLDQQMRDKTRQAVAGLAQLAPRGAWAVQPDGEAQYRPLHAIAVDDRVRVAAGDRVPVDGRVVSGVSTVDRSLVSGESTPHPVQPGDALVAGTLNLSAPLTLAVSAAADASFLAQTQRLMEAAEVGRGRYRRIADRAAALYAPVVHTLAALSGVGWFLATGDGYLATTIAVAVLIITCPCALGLAVPMVHLMASRRLFERGMLVKDGAALERLSRIDTVVFDKTGTLTLDSAALIDDGGFDDAGLALAAGLAKHSRHPRAQSLTTAARQRGLILDDELSAIAEIPGCGLQACRQGERVRLGRADWALPGSADATSEPDSGGLVLVCGQQGIARFHFDDTLRPDVESCLEQLKTHGYAIELLSGDGPAATSVLARRLSIARYLAAATPAQKVDRIRHHERRGRRVLMVGDGINDAPALIAAHASMAPGSAADIGRNAADVVFLRGSLQAVPQALDLARRAARLVHQNFALAVVYNLLALPVAVLGYVTPLLAAVAMSLSSLLVIGNALRLRIKQHV